jgi:hypothetical protein
MFPFGLLEYLLKRWWSQSAVIKLVLTPVVISISVLVVFFGVVASFNFIANTSCSILEYRVVKEHLPYIRLRGILEACGLELVEMPNDKIDVLGDMPSASKARIANVRIDFYPGIHKVDGRTGARISAVSEQSWLKGWLCPGDVVVEVNGRGFTNWSGTDTGNQFNHNLAQKEDFVIIYRSGAGGAVDQRLEAETWRRSIGSPREC